MSAADRRAADLVGQFSLILGELEGFPAEEVKRVDDLVHVGEWAVELENLCSQPYEYEFVVPPESSRPSKGWAGK